MAIETHYVFSDIFFHMPKKAICFSFQPYYLNVLGYSRI